MQIGNVARLSGVSVGTLRYYEKRGLLPRPARSASGYRSYTDAAVVQVRLIRWAKRLGFTLREARELMQVAREHGRGRTRPVQARAAAKMREVDEKIQELIALRQQLEKVSRCACDGDCPIIREATGTAHP